MINIDHNADPETLLTQLEQVFPLISRMEETEQDHIWHAEGNVRIHTRMVLDRLESRDDIVLVLACALHDIAKALTTIRQWKDSEGRECVSSPRHAVVGRTYLLQRIHRLSGMLSVEQADLICALVGYHHHVKSAVKVHDMEEGHDESPLMTAGEQARMYGLARVADIQRLYHLETCDTLGRISASDPPDWTDKDRVWWLDWYKDVAEFHRVWDRPAFDGWREHFETAFENPEVAEAALYKAVYDFTRKKIYVPEEGIARTYEWKTKFPKLVMLCGPPGSGKSTVASRYEHVVSLDQIRQEIAGGRHDQKQNGQVRQEAQKRLRQHLAAGHTVCFDATSLYRDQRSGLLSMAHKYDAATHLIAFATDPDALRERNKTREHPVPDQYLEECIDGYVFPAATEAHRLSIVDGWGERDMGAV